MNSVVQVKNHFLLAGQASSSGYRWTQTQDFCHRNRVSGRMLDQLSRACVRIYNVEETLMMVRARISNDMCYEIARLEFRLLVFLPRINSDCLVFMLTCFCCQLRYLGRWKVCQ